MPRNIINDGYTRTAYIKPLDGIHGGLTVTYRPMIAEQVEDLYAEERKAPVKEAARKTAERLAKHIQRWDEEGDGGEVALITLENIRRLPPMLFYDLKNTITGSRASDPLPEANGRDSEIQKASAEKAAEGHKMPGLAVLNEQQKN